MQQINEDLYREKTDKRKETVFFCLRILVWVATLAALFALAANLRVAVEEPEASKEAEMPKKLEKAEEEEDDIEEEEIFVIDEKEQELVMYDGEYTDVVVPEGVVRIGMDAFEKNEYLRSVTLPE